MNQKLLDKFLNHQASEKEIQMLKDDPETADFMHLSEQAAALKYSGFKAQENWEVIDDHIKDNAGDRKKYSSHATDKNSVKRLFTLNQGANILWQVAAIFILALGTYFFFSPSNISLINPEGAHQSWTLPDGSQISLNAGSEANYDPESWDSDRTIELDGEAFFDVTKGSTFSVKTNSGVVTVLGTEFNVKVREGQFYVHCFEGLVKVQTSDTTLMLPAGNGMRLDHEQWQKDIVSLGARPDWINGESSFVNSALEAVFEELSRQYAVKITYSKEFTPEMKSERFNGSFTHEDLNIALRSVCEPFGLSFQRTNNQVSIFKN